MKKTNYHVIKDPVHGTMQFTDAEHHWIRPFIDSAPIQRLRHIKQLGMADLIFPGAVHTRFNHSLGCSYVGSQIAHKIHLSDRDRQLVMIACLLHDVGHGPFSHAFEGVFHRGLIHHEAWTPLFLMSYCEPQFFEMYNHLNPNAPLDEVVFQDIANMIMHRAVSKPLLADIVSSQLDADRLDYLLRDSHFCGVKYGEFDFRWMLHCLAIIESNGVERLGVNHRGVGVCEHYLMARRLIMRNIGRLPKKLAIEKWLVDLLSLLSAQLGSEPAFAHIKQTRLGEFLYAANRFNAEADDNPHVDALITSFLHDHFYLYGALCDYDVFIILNALAEMNSTHSVCELAKRIVYREMPSIVHLSRGNVLEIQSILEEFKSKNSSRFLDWQIQLVAGKTDYYSQAEPVWVRDDDGVVLPITEYSMMIDALSHQSEHLPFLMVDRHIMGMDSVKRLLRQIKLLNQERAMQMTQSDAEYVI